MRLWCCAVLLVVGCQSEEPGKGGEDGVDTIDTDDTVEAGPVEFDSIEPIREPIELEFQGVDVVAYSPAEPVGLVMVFHGTGGNAGVTTSTEMVAILNEMVRLGFGYVATSSVNRDSGQFDLESAPGNNPDIAVLDALRDSYIAEGAITEELPIFTLGFSAGGGMANYVAHAAAELEWPVQAAALLGAGGGTRYYSGTASVPVMFLPSENDERVLPETVIDRHEDHEASGNTSVLMMCDEVSLVPTRFARTRFLNQNQSRQIFDEAVSGGFWDADGNRLFGVDAIDANIDDFTNNYDVINAKPVRAQLNVVLATHAINGMHAEAMAAFFEDHL